MEWFKSKSSKKITRYVVNGREYSSLDRMPPEVRKLFEDNNGDGRPAWLKSPLQRSMSCSTFESIEFRTVNGVTTYRVGDVEYSSLEEMPSEHRKLFEDRDRDGLPGGFPGFGRIVSEVGVRSSPLPGRQTGKTVEAVDEPPGSASTRGGGSRPIDAAPKPSADTVFLMILGVVAALVLALAALLVKLVI